MEKKHFLLELGAMPDIMQVQLFLELYSYWQVEKNQFPIIVYRTLP